MATTLFPLQYLRQNAGPIDVDSVFDTTADRIAYLANGRRYPGQIVADLEDQKIYVLNTAASAWLSIDGIPAGSTGQIQYNNAGDFGANSGFTYDSATCTVGLSKIANTIPVNINVGNSNSWIAEYGDIGAETAEDYTGMVAYDTLGYIYVSGADATAGQPFLVKIGPTGNLVWQKTFTDPGSHYKTGDAVKVDTAGNIYLTLANADPGNTSVYVIKLDAAANIIWQRNLDNPAGPVYGVDIDYDGSGNVYVLSTDQGNNTSILVKYNSSGVLQWQRSFAGINDVVPYLYVDTAGNSYYTANSVTGIASLPLLLKYDTTGTLLWQKQVSYPGNQPGIGDIVVDSLGNIIFSVTGFTGGPPQTIGIIKCNSAGTVLWQRNIVDTYPYIYYSGGGIAVDSSDNIYFQYQNFVEPTYRRELAVLKYSSTGTLLWARSLSGADDVGTFYYWSNDNLDVLGSDYVVGGHSYNPGLVNSNVVVAQLPIDGSGVGTWGNYTYAVLPVVETTTAYTLATSTLPEDAGFLTDTAGDLSITDAAYTLQSTPVANVWTFDTDGTTRFPNYTFPSSDGFSGQALITDGSGNVSWSNAYSGYSGIAGASGFSGVAGISSTIFEYYADTGSTTGDPGLGDILWNNSPQTGATALHISHTTNDGIDIDIYLALLQATEVITLQDKAASANYQRWGITGAPTNINPGLSNSYWVVPVELLSSGGTGSSGFLNGSELILALVQGVSGISGVSGYSGYYGTSGYSGAGGSSGYSGAIGPGANLATPTSIGTVFGYTTGGGNISIGCCSGNTTQSGCGNVAIGFEALKINTTGNHNIAVGYCALKSNLYGNHNTAVGYGSLFCNQGSNNLAIGYGSLCANISGSENIAIGYGTLSGITTGYSNIAIGLMALYGSNFSVRNIGIGERALEQSDTLGSIGLGYMAGLCHAGCNGVFIGWEAGKCSQGGQNIGIGVEALYSYYSVFGCSASNSYQNIGIGTYALSSNCGGNYNVAIGTESMMFGTGAAENTALGFQSLRSISTGNGNTVIGNQAGSTITTGSYNTFLGWQAGTCVTTGVNNTVIGSLPAAAGCLCTLLIGAGTCERVRVDNTGLYINGSLYPNSLYDTFTNLSGATGVVTHDFSLGPVFRHTAIASNFTVNVTNIGLASGSVTNISLLLVQGATAYMANALQIAGVAQTINWRDGSAPTGTANKVDIVNFSILNNSGTYTVIGQGASFG